MQLGIPQNMSLASTCSGLVDSDVSLSLQVLQLLYSGQVGFTKHPLSQTTCAARLEVNTFAWAVTLFLFIFSTKYNIAQGVG